MKVVVENFCLSVICLSLLGCATVVSSSGELGKKMGIDNQQGAAATGGAVIGCLGGALLGYATGIGAAKGCGAGAVVIGTISAVTVYQQQLDEAKKIQKEAQGSGYTVVLTEKPAPRESNPASAANQSSASRLNTMTLDLPKKSVDAKDPEVAAIARKVVLLAARDPKGALITVEGTKARRDYLSSLLTQAIPAESQKLIRVESKASIVNTRMTLASVG